MLLCRLSLDTYIRNWLTVVVSRERNWVTGGHFSNPFVAFVPFELFSLGVYKQFNNKVFYLKV